MRQPGFAVRAVASASSGSSLIVGIYDATHSLSNYIGTGTNGLGWDLDGHVLPRYQMNEAISVNVVAKAMQSAMFI